MLSFSFFFLSFFLFVFSEKPFWDENKVCMYVCILQRLRTSAKAYSYVPVGTGL